MSWEPTGGRLYMLVEIVRPANETELRQALAMLLVPAGSSKSQTDLHVNALCRYAKRSGLSLDHCYVARVGGALRAACLCLDMPGRVGLLMLPSQIPDEQAASDVAGILEPLAADARRRGVQFLQATLPVEALREFEILSSTGFRHLADLIYLEGEPDRVIREAGRVPAVSFEAYQPSREPLFGQVVLETYEGSLDCGTINGLRRIEDILASHRGVGRFDERLWLLARCESKPAGVLLMAELPEVGELEIVYVGLKPAFRGRGLGRALMVQAAQTARRLAVMRLTVAVDSRNGPARRLYERLGFAERFRRAVWIRILENVPDGNRGSECGSGPDVSDLSRPGSA